MKLFVRLSLEPGDMFDRIQFGTLEMDDAAFKAASDEDCEKILKRLSDNFTRESGRPVAEAEFISEDTMKAYDQLGALVDGCGILDKEYTIYLKVMFVDDDIAFPVAIPSARSSGSMTPDEISTICDLVSTICQNSENSNLVDEVLLSNRSEYEALYL